LTRGEMMSRWNGGGANREFITTNRATYDSGGRIRDAYDALDRRTTTTYTPASGAPVTSGSTTNPKGRVSTQVLEPAWGRPTKVTDPNNRVTEVAYDASGRPTNIWAPGWDRGAHPTLSTSATSYTVRSSGGPSYVRTSRLNTAGTGTVDSFDLF